MTKEQTEKLQDYLEGLLGVNNTDTPPVGAVLVEENIHDKVLDFMVDKKMHIFNNSSDNMLENNLEKLSSSIEKGQAVVIDSGVELSPVLNNLFLDFIHGKLSFNIPGKGQKVINPVSGKTKAVFVLTKDLFDNSDRFSKVVSSVCRL